MHDIAPMLVEFGIIVKTGFSHYKWYHIGQNVNNFKIAKFVSLLRVMALECFPNKLRLVNFINGFYSLLPVIECDQNKN